jgi:hypothetical protein
VTAMEKKCSKCGEIKSIDEFYKRSDRKNSYASSCKKCKKKYAEKNKSKIAKRMKEYGLKNKDSKTLYNKKYYKENIDDIKANNKIYSKSESGKKVIKKSRCKYKKSEKGKISDKGQKKRYRKNNLHKIRAKECVLINTRNGKLVRPKTCSLCGNKSIEIHAHHWSYLQEHWLDVVWCCVKCHNDIHNDKFDQVMYIQHLHPATFLEEAP